MGTSISSTTIICLEVGASVSLKAANKLLFRGKATLKIELFTLFF